MSVLKSPVTTAAMNGVERWPIRDGSGRIIGSAASQETARYIESSNRAVEIRVISHA